MRFYGTWFQGPLHWYMEESAMCARFYGLVYRHGYFSSQTRLGREVIPDPAHFVGGTGDDLHWEDVQSPQIRDFRWDFKLLSGRLGVTNYTCTPNPDYFEPVPDLVVSYNDASSPAQTLQFRLQFLSLLKRETYEWEVPTSQFQNGQFLWENFSITSSEYSSIADARWTFLSNNLITFIAVIIIHLSSSYLYELSNIVNHFVKTYVKEQRQLKAKEKEQRQTAGTCGKKRFNRALHNIKKRALHN